MRLINIAVTKSTNTLRNSQVIRLVRSSLTLHQQSCSLPVPVPISCNSCAESDTNNNSNSLLSSTGTVDSSGHNAVVACVLLGRDDVLAVLLAALFPVQVG